VSTEVRVRGTHTAPLVSPDGEIPPTGKSIDITAHNTMRTDADGITALEVNFDQAAFMRQLGIG
jgi:hypothetical protein